MTPVQLTDDVDMLVNVARVRRLASGSDDSDDRQWLALAFRRYLLAADDGLTMEDALGLTSTVRGWPWYRVMAVGSRDANIRELARCFSPSPSLARKAQYVADMMQEYSRTKWLEDRLCDICPADAAGTPREILFGIMKADEALLSDRSLRRILAGS